MFHGKTGLFISPPPPPTQSMFNGAQRPQVLLFMTWPRLRPTLAGEGRGGGGRGEGGGVQEDSHLSRILGRGSHYLMLSISGLKCGVKVRNFRLPSSSGVPNTSNSCSLRVSDE